MTWEIWAWYAVIFLLITGILIPTIYSYKIVESEKRVDEKIKALKLKLDGLEEYLELTNSTSKDSSELEKNKMNNE